MIDEMDERDAAATLESLHRSLTMQRASLAAEGLVPPAAVVTVASSPDGEEPVLNVDESDIEAVLHQLREEPADDDERASKFAIFEGFLSTVEKVRDDTFKFWEDAKIEFEGGGLRAAEAQLRRLDTRDSMGLSDDVFSEGAGAWFVQPMARQASRNSVALTSTLSSLRAKLMLLGKEDTECPCCLEPLAQDGLEVTTLSCCHRCCTSCWESWCQARIGQTAFCPLCRHADFLEYVLGAAAGGGD
jgi:hypothetical protein